MPSPAGGYTPFGIEGWRVVFLTVGIVSFALGILNYFFAHDPRYGQDNKSMLKEHQHGMSFWGAVAEMKKIVVIPSFAIIILQASLVQHVSEPDTCACWLGVPALVAVLAGYLMVHLIILLLCM